jgi:hypothetical protein
MKFSRENLAIYVMVGITIILIAMALYGWWAGLWQSMPDAT